MEPGQNAACVIVVERCIDWSEWPLHACCKGSRGLVLEYTTYMKDLHIVVLQVLPGAKDFGVFVLWSFQPKSGILIHKLIKEFVKSKEVQWILVIFFLHEA